MSVVPENEGKACDAVVRWLEERTGNTRTDVCLPEKCGVGPPVEMRLLLGHPEFAIEHTRIEPFLGFFKTGVSLNSIVKPIKDAVSGKLSRFAHYVLLLPADPHIQNSNLERFKNEVIRQILECAPNLYNEALISERKASTQPLNNLPFPVNLSCRILPGRIDIDESGKFYVGRYEPDDLEMKLKRRLRKALYDKCPKLNKCVDTRTVLVLENNDLALTSEVAVRDTLQRIFADDKFNVDEIFLIDTWSKTWILWPIKRGLYWPKIDYDMHTKWDPDQLTDVTSSECCPLHPSNPFPKPERNSV